VKKQLFDFKIIFTFTLTIIYSSVGWAQQQPSFWTGNGGKDIRITVAEPVGKGLSADEQSLIPLIQSTIIGSIQKFSAMTIFDRQNLENILSEQKMSLSGDFSDNDFIRIGHLTNANLIVFGSINKISSNYFIEFAVTDVETGERKASYPPKQVSLLSLQGFSAVKDASADLLSQLGVNLTDRAIQELKRAENTTRIQAENLLARGITAQRQGSVADAFSYYFQAASLEPSLREAISRASVVSTSVSGGIISQNVRNRLKVHDEWRTIVNAAKTFYSNHLPYEFVYDTNINRGAINFDRRTINLTIGLSLIPTDAWKAINDLRRGLNKARQPSENWNFNLNQIEPRRIVVTLEILNTNNVILSRGTFTFSNPSEANRVNATLNFTNVKADDLTDRLTVRVVSINNIPAQQAGETGFIQITTLAAYNRRQNQLSVAETKTIIEKRRREEIEQIEYRRLREEMKAYYAKQRVGLEILTAYYQWGIDGNRSVGTEISFYWSFLQFTSIGLESRFGGEIIEGKDTFDYTNFNFSPIVGLSIPFNSGKAVMMFTDGIIEFGKFDPWKGLITDWLSPGFDIGLLFGHFINLKYRGIWYKDSYTHSITLGLFFSRLLLEPVISIK